MNRGHTARHLFIVWNKIFNRPIMKQYIFSVGTYNMYGEEYHYTETISANSLESALEELNIRYAFFTEWGYKLVRVIDISVS